MTESIFHLGEDGSLTPMREEPFALEDSLQELVARHPKLLSGEQINPGEPRRWILIRREQGIADTEGAAHRWALDHLLIDQDAIPTLVEVKRSNNSEIRRTIVGQMLDYAAHATRTWNVGDIRQSFEESGENPENSLAKLLQSDSDPDADEFWQRVETNLRAARIRLLFVADGIPDELTRVVEFLNEQMPGIEVLAVEIKQFSGAAGQTLVPRVIGRTAASVPSRSSALRSRTNREEFLDRLPSPQVREAAGRLMRAAEENGGFVSFGDVAISIRCQCPAWSKGPISIAWINPFPGRVGWAGTRNFTFGMPHNWEEIESSPPVIEILKTWSDQFKNDSFATDVPREGVLMWSITHEEATDNIDVLTERLANVLKQLATLPAETQE